MAFRPLSYHRKKRQQKCSRKSQSQPPWSPLRRPSSPPSSMNRLRGLSSENHWRMTTQLRRRRWSKRRCSEFSHTNPPGLAPVAYWLLRYMNSSKFRVAQKPVNRRHKVGGGLIYTLSATRSWAIGAHFRSSQNWLLRKPPHVISARCGLRSRRLCRRSQLDRTNRLSR